MDTKLLEIESGLTENESVTWGVRSAIEASVLALIEQGDERGFWKIVYPEDWDEQVAEQEQAYWLKVSDKIAEPMSDAKSEFGNNDESIVRQIFYKKDS